MGVVEGEIIDKLEGWLCPLTPFVFECHGCLGECTIKLGYVPFLTTIVFKRVDSVWGPISLEELLLGWLLFMFDYIVLSTLNILLEVSKLEYFLKFTWAYIEKELFSNLGFVIIKNEEIVKPRFN